MKNYLPGSRATAELWTNVKLIVSLYVKGFGAAAVRDLIKAAMKNFAD